MRALENELIDDTINADGTTYQLLLDIPGIRVYEMVRIEMCKFLSSNATRKLRTSAMRRNMPPPRNITYRRHMVDIWLLHHRRHRLRHRRIFELPIRMLVPNRLEIEPRAIHARFEE